MQEHHNTLTPTTAAVEGGTERNNPFEQKVLKKKEESANTGMRTKQERLLSWMHHKNKWGTVVCNTPE